MDTRARMTVSLINRLNAFAKANGTTATAVVRRSCAQYLAVDATRPVALPTREETTREDSCTLRFTKIPEGVNGALIPQIVTWYLNITPF